MAQHFLIFSTICFSSIVLLGGASGTEKENYNHSTTIGKIKREVQDSQDSPHDGSGSRSNLNNDRAEKTTANDDDYAESNINHLPLNFVDTMSGLPQLNMVKRAPNGFTGMRGKKRTEPTDYAQNTFDWNTGWDIDDTLVSPDRSLQDLANTWSDDNRERFKKTPSAFYGVRGKKYSESYGRSNNLDELMRKVDEERLREEFLQNFLDRIATSTLYENEIQKRTPSGFTGMRGKRDMNDNDYQTQNDKRSPGNTFLGVRGKKAMLDHEAVKRSPTQHMAFFGTRGKKQPFVDFRNKFVGVRGKKSFTASRTSADESSSPTQNIRNSLGELYSEEIEPNYDVQTRYLVDMYPLFFGSSGKRAPNGFLGMRGKRAT